MSKWSQKRRVMRRYDLTAELYDARYAEEQEAKYKSALGALQVAAESIVLDVGCGTGLLFSHVAPEAQTVVGVDASRKLLLRAKDRANRFSNIHIVQADADYLPFKNGFFRVIFAFTVLQNMPRPLETLRELRRTATIDAAFIVVTGLKKVFPMDAFVALLRQAGLRVVSMRDDASLRCYVAVTVQGP